MEADGADMDCGLDELRIFFFRIFSDFLFQPDWKTQDKYASDGYKMYCKARIIS
jgi:hypothetical protein